MTKITLDLNRGIPFNLYEDELLGAVLLSLFCDARGTEPDGLHDMLVHQSINPSMTNLIRWQNHRYVLKQSLGFFQNDFAGRIAQRIMQTGNSLRDSAVQVVDALWHVLIYTVSALVLFAEADWRLMLPFAGWLLGYGLLMRWFVPRMGKVSQAQADARSTMTGRIVDSYTNIATVKLFSHSQREQAYAHEAMDGFLDTVYRQMRLATRVNVLLYRQVNLLGCQH